MGDVTRSNAALGASGLVRSRAFADEGAAAVHGLRRSLAELLKSVGANPAEPQELARRFKLDKTLTWRISRVIREEDPWEAVGHIPGRPSIRALTDRLESSGATAQSAEAVRRAMEVFEDFVSRHSGDRETLEIMAGVGSRPSAAKRQEQFRKQGFQANSSAWGVQASVQFACNIMAPSSEAGMLDLAAVSGIVGLRRLRPNVPWVIGSVRAWEDSSPEIDARPEPIIPGDVVDGVPILRDHCSQPLPKLRTKVSAGGSKRFEVTEGTLGFTGASTVVTGWKWARTASVYGTVADDSGEHGVHLSTPVEVAIHDLLVHKSLGFAMNPIARSYSQLPGGPEYPFDGPDAGRMPMPEDVVSLGAGPPNLTTLEIPRYPELVETTLRALGWRADDFHGFRHRVRYPTIPTLAILRHPLLARQ